MSARIFIETAGCAFNSSDSEAMAGVLQQAGYEIVDSQNDAELIVLNTCTVKDRTFRSFRKRLDDIRGDSRRRVVIAGCIPKAYEQTGLLKEVSTLGPDAVGHIEEIVRETLRGKVAQRLGREAATRRSALPLLRRNPVVEILPIARGCRSACAFCQTRIARGRLQSFPPGEVLEQARRALDAGVKVFWITGQDTGAYGHDSGVSLPHLLRQLLDLDGDFRVRLGMSSPQWIDDRLDEYVDLLEHPKMFKFLHVPLQSGSERVLQDMKRDGGVREFTRIHAAFLDRFPDGSLVTDLIVGFPTEGEEDFDATIDLVNRLGLGFMNVSKFSPRPGTAAARLKPLPSQTVSRRSKHLMVRMREIAGDYLRARVGAEASILIEQEHRNGRYLGRTENYRPVVLNQNAKPGQWYSARLTGTEAFHFTGCFVDDHANSNSAPYL